MQALFFKEISGFFNSVLGYLVIIVFLVINSLFVWILESSSVIDYGYATLDPLFANAPYIYLVLIPAITMKAFAEERKTGTLEILLTRPLSELQIIVTKFLAGCALVVLSLLPTLIYVFSIRALASPAGNVDMAAIWGSYLGLIFLGAVYVSIGVFASSLTDNQIVSFIYAVSICIFFTFGLTEIAQITSVKAIDLLIIKFGVSEHYNSISRGVVDSRDVLYFIGICAFFIAATNLVLNKRKW